MLACAIFAHAEREVDYQPLIGGEAKELLTENLEEEFFLDDFLNAGLLLSAFCGGHLSDKQTCSLYGCSVVDRFTVPFSGWIAPLRI